MNILIANQGQLPVIKYGGTERVVWSLGKELVKKGHKVAFLVNEGSYCDFADVIFFDNSKNINEQIPESTDIVHLNFQPDVEIKYPYIVSIHGSRYDFGEYDINTVFVSKNHATRYGSSCFVYNGLDWDDYGKPDMLAKRNYFHFLGAAAWRLKNVKGAIKIISLTKNEKLKVLGGNRLNFRMGFRLTLNPRVSFEGMVGGTKKNKLLNESKGLILPVRTHEAFGLALIESLYFGCPVFGTPYGSLPEIITEEFGFLADNAQDLSQAILQVDKYDRYKCNQYVIDKFNSKNMTEGYLEKYEIVLNGNTLNKTKPRLVHKQEEKFLPWND
jgi:glycosyltransferase involved in cell wall biosynthesis